MNSDVNSVLLMADIVLYGSDQDVQGFPPLLIRAMTFGIPVIAPDFPILKKYVSSFKLFSFWFIGCCIVGVSSVLFLTFSKRSLKLQVVDGIHGIFFPKHNPDALMRAFSLLISNGKLSEFAQTVASSGRLLAKNILASECITGYARLLENVLNFSSDAMLPGSISQLQQGAWEWNLFRKEIEKRTVDMQNVDEKATLLRKYSVVYALEEEFTNFVYSTNGSANGTGILSEDMLTKLDWDVLRVLESSEEDEMIEMEEVRCILHLQCLSCPPPSSLSKTNPPPLAGRKKEKRKKKFCVSSPFLQKTAKIDYYFLICSLKIEWTETLEHGMIFIVMLAKLKKLSLKQTKGMRESLRGQARLCAFTRSTVELGPGHSCTMVLCTVV